MSNSLIEPIITMKSSHDLIYEQSDPTELEPGRKMAGYKVGTCHGLVIFDDAINLLAVINNEPGNGHFDDVMEWFHYACRIQKKDFRVIELFNQRLKWHLINKRGFVAVDQMTVVKRWEDC